MLQVILKLRRIPNVVYLMAFTYNMTQFLRYIDLCTCLELMVTLGHLEPLLGQCTLHGPNVDMIFESFGGC